LQQRREIERIRAALRRAERRGARGHRRGRAAGGDEAELGGKIRRLAGGPPRDARVERLVEIDAAEVRLTCSEPEPAGELCGERLYARVAVAAGGRDRAIVQVCRFDARA